MKEKPVNEPVIVTLPSSMKYNRHLDFDTQAVLEAAGVKFLELAGYYELYRNAELPSGWKTIHSAEGVPLCLLDGKGRVRANMFFDQYVQGLPHMSASCRYSVVFDSERFDKDQMGVAHVMDTTEVVYTTEPIPANGEDKYAVSDKAKALAKKWLDENYPNWKVPSAYWE